MKIKLLSLSVVLGFALLSCNVNHNVLFVTFENGENISKGNPVLMNGIKIGRIEQIEFDKKYHVRLKIRFNEKQNIPNDSKFSIGSEDIFSKAVLINPGQSKTYYTAEDKIEGEKSPEVEFDEVLDWFADRFEESGAKSAVDSIASGLNELSKKIDEFENMEIEIKKRP